MSGADGGGKPLRVALMIGSMREGGAEGQVVELMRGLRERGHIVRLYLLHPEGPRMEVLRAEGFEVFGIALPKLRPLWNPASKIGAVRALARTIGDLRRFRPDVLHSWLFEADAWAALAKLGGAPGALITSRRSIGRFKDAAPWKQRVQNQYNRLSRLVIANAEAVAEDARAREANLPRLGIRVIPNGIHAERVAAARRVVLEAEIPTLAGATHRVVCVANLLEYKGHLDLIAAWRAVHERLPGAHLILVGRDDGMAERIRSAAAEAGLSGVVHLLGSRRDVPGILRACDLFVLPSHEEGLPNVVLEAQACGLAAVATRAGGSPEALRDGETGLIVPPHAPAELAAALLRLLKNDAERHRMGQAAAQFLRTQFPMTRMIDAHVAAYREILGLKG
ncbi:MAG: glycosyltransferase [Sumerlaeia bacterium]